jgi:hypothetical protein
MNLPAGFHWHEAPTPEIIALLNETTLGTNGARYRHLDTIDRIHEADHPLFLTLEWRERVLGNLTFCRRNQHWYIRYFAFHRSFQASKQTRQKQGDSRFKTGIKAFFEKQLNAGDVDTFYAFIDPKNDRSKWMSEQFGFRVASKLVTQSFSRIVPKKSKRLTDEVQWNSLEPLVNSTYGNHQYFFTHHLARGPFYALQNEQGELLACGKFTRVTWEIERLPGRFGQIIVKCLPYMPILNRLIRPKKHVFLSPEGLFVRGNEHDLLTELFEAVLHAESCNVLMWWADQKDPLFLATNQQIRWGILNRIVGQPEVDVVIKEKEGTPPDKRPFYVSAFDLI